MTDEYKALGVFIGDWSATGTAYGADREGVEWRSVHSARWHSGGFFVVQDERANGPFDTLGLLGWDGERDAYFLRSVENHGFARDYALTVEGHVWTLTGDQERATITFSDDGRTQTHHWEFRPDGEWTTLCDRTAVRVE